MIGFLRGSLLDKEERDIVLDVNGIGYVVSPTAQALESLPDLGEEAELLIYTLVREDEIRLFGFSSSSERRLFTLLMQVSGVGCNSALQILSRLGTDTIVEALVQEQVAPFTTVKGIGKRTAERIVLELKDKVLKSLPGFTPAVRTRAVPAPGNLGELDAALQALGYRRNEIADVLKDLREQKDAPLEHLLREALGRMRR